jgi:RimJ/RimL family protein N-acetyltransferase
MAEIDYSKYFWQNDLVRLRALRAEDWERSFQSRFDSEARRVLNYEIELPPTEVGVQADIAKYTAFAPGTGRLMFGIETLSGEVVGGLNLNSIDERNGTFSIGMQIDPSHRGKGYGTAAMRVLLRYAFYERRLNKYYGSILDGNTPSARMLEKLGCKEEGRRKEMVYTEGKYLDEILYGLTRKEFDEAERKRIKDNQSSR